MPDDMEDLLWGRRAPAPRGRPPKLSLDRIVTTAMRIADREGLAALSMKRLAEELESGVMSLYHHVPGKDELVALMADTAYGEPPDTETGDDWYTALHRWAHALRTVFHAHPWLTDPAISPGVVGPNETAWLEAELTALARLRQPLADAMKNALAVSSYVRGAVQPEIHRRAPRFGHSAVDRNRFPLVSSFADTARAHDSDPLADFFDVGLRRLLHGIRASVPPQNDTDT
ncbi:TetR family transcriptional regulator [Stackebrandtia albiflava]|uniref:TetR family transcriptional regulator n=1 Tax=Stackebrandtia albiflava TaxID=406432 RepID=A0A562V9Z5_9ACTN|nr:TetR/AcrR family transcriptional regulator [Stackebrandtia albiflava]TWJ14661.1 TetR family transcriptional regulator [Stackebrandtia albiflava]